MADGASARVRVLTLEYEAVDGFFALFPPPIPAEGKGPRLVVTPFESKTIGVSVALSPEGVDRRLVEIDVTQRGHRLEQRAARDVEGMAFGPARLGRPVAVRIVNDAPMPIEGAELFVDWT